MRDAVEVTTQISVDHLSVALVQQRLHVPQGIPSAALRSIGVLLRLQISLEDRLQDHQGSRLHDPVFDRGDAERSLRPIGFRDPYPPHGLRTIRSLPQFFRQFVQPPPPAILLDVRERLVVDPTGAPVLPAAVVGPSQHVGAVHLVVEQVEAIARRSLRFGMQRLAQLPNLLWRFQAHANLPAVSP
jgi:hypothetical protein